jgi:hypothetical protein
VVDHQELSGLAEGVPADRERLEKLAVKYLGMLELAMIERHLPLFSSGEGGADMAENWLRNRRFVGSSPTSCVRCN